MTHDLCSIGRTVKLTKSHRIFTFTQFYVFPRCRSCIDLFHWRHNPERSRIDATSFKGLYGWKNKLSRGSPTVHISTFYQNYIIWKLMQIYFVFKMSSVTSCTRVHIYKKCYNIAFVNSESWLAKSRVDVTPCQQGKFSASLLLKFLCYIIKGI